MVYKIDDHWILSERGKKNPVDPEKPYAFLVEKERSRDGRIDDTGIIFLTNRECPFHCLMCDLWKNTTDKPVHAGVIPGQIEYALSRMPDIRHIKLYNSGSFFDPGAIPEDDYNDIASLLRSFETLIVESHPHWINEKCVRFRDMLKPELQIAIGLETSDNDLLIRLNKKMTIDDFRNSVTFLNRNNIKSRAFILLRPPFLSEPEGIYWAERSVEFAFNCGVECCTIIPVRGGNGAMEKLASEGLFEHPSISSLEDVLEYSINLNARRVFADLWDLHLFSECDKCTDARRNRLSEMNLYQTILPAVKCDCRNS